MRCHVARPEQQGADAFEEQGETYGPEQQGTDAFHRFHAVGVHQHKLVLHAEAAADEHQQEGAESCDTEAAQLDQRDEHNLAEAREFTADVDHRKPSDAGGTGGGEERRDSIAPLTTGVGCRRRRKAPMRSPIKGGAMGTRARDAKLFVLSRFRMATGCH